MFDFGCADGGACDGGGDGGAGVATTCDMDYTAGYGQFQFGYNESAADVDMTGVDVHCPELHYHESTDVASYFDSWYSSSTTGDIWWRKIAIPVMCGIITVFILVFSFKVTKDQDEVASYSRNSGTDKPRALPSAVPQALTTFQTLASAGYKLLT